MSVSPPPSTGPEVELRRVRVRVRRGVPLRRRLLRRPLLLLAIAAAALLAALAVDVVVRYLPAVDALRAGRDAAQQASDLLRSASTHLDVATVDRAARLLDEAAADFGPRSAVVQDGLLGSLAGHLPGAGRQVDALRALRRSGQAAIAVGRDLAPLGRRLVAPGGDGGGTALARLAAVAGSSGAQLDRVRADLDALDASVAAIPGDNLAGPLTDARDTLRRQAAALDGSLRPALAFAGALPRAIGPGRHTYLLLLTNPAEERPGGGFIGAVGTVTFADGRLAGAQFRVSDFANATVRSLAAPRALDQYMFHGVPWQLSDANWSPDFPTSAAQVLGFWRLATGTAPDGVIDVDPVALGDLLRVLGPVSVAHYPQRVGPDDTLLQVNRIVNEPGQPGKAFLAPFGAAVVDQVTRARAEQLPRLAAALAGAIAHKHLLLHFDDPVLQGLVSRADAGGEISARSGDSLLVADANLSAGKEDLFVHRTYGLTAQVGADGTVRDHLTLTYTNAGPSEPRDRPLVAAGGGAYRDYLQVYLPAGATVDGLTLKDGTASQPLSPDSVAAEDGRRAVGVFIVVPPGATVSVSLDEHLHLDTARGYRLAWDKQANALDWPVSLTVVAPDGHTAHRSTMLDADRAWTIPLY